MAALYNTIGKNYDTTRAADPEIVDIFTQLLNIQPTNNYLDIACGTGNYTIELKKRGSSRHGFDQSQRMLEEAKTKSSAVHWANFDVAQLGYSDKQFDGAICSLAIHHFPNLDLAFNEIRRVLKPDASLVIFTSTPEQMCTYWLNHYFPKMMEKSCSQMPSLENIQESLGKNHFTLKNNFPFFIKPDLKDFFLYSGKQKPEIYLSENVRNGISSFKNFCTDKELKAGLNKLAVDIHSGDIWQHIEKTRHCSDYLFIHAIAK